MELLKIFAFHEDEDFKAVRLPYQTLRARNDHRLAERSERSSQGQRKTRCRRPAQASQGHGRDEIGAPRSQAAAIQSAIGEEPRRADAALRRQARFR